MKIKKYWLIIFLLIPLALAYTYNLDCGIHTLNPEIDFCDNDNYTFDVLNLNTGTYESEGNNLTLLQGNTYNATYNFSEGNWRIIYCDDSTSTVSITCAAAAADTTRGNGILECMYDSTPYIREAIPFIWEERELISWSCNITNATNNIYDCMTFAYFNNDIIQTNPESEYIEGIGVIDTFRAEPELAYNQIANIHFTNRNLRDDKWVIFEVLCSTDHEILEYSANVTPQYKDPYEVFDVSEYGRDNAGIIIGFALIILFIIIIIGVIWRISKN